ncbi:S-adenosyl-L-methionine-dependent methyltransferase [Hyaloraphidium curvatum]|nr:S-adenosyl-L-methionine-dependent methyltransferase [Hyaloraphidium curvatum]
MDPAQTAADYSNLSSAYAEHLSSELDGKPFDRALLDAFAARWAGRTVADVGCGPGHVAAYLAARGVRAVGLDASEGMVAEARRRHSELQFEIVDLLGLGASPGRFDAAIAFYSLIHFDDEQLARALDALLLCLKPGGELVAAAHLGDAPIRPGEMWGVPVSLDFRMFAEGELERAIASAGFDVVEAQVREPYPGVEHASRRTYVRAVKPV